jgi:hypothetical protein
MTTTRMLLHNKRERGGYSDPVIETLKKRVGAS